MAEDDEWDATLDAACYAIEKLKTAEWFATAPNYHATERYRILGEAQQAILPGWYPIVIAGV